MVYGYSCELYLFVVIYLCVISINDTLISKINVKHITRLVCKSAKYYLINVKLIE